MHTQFAVTEGDHLTLLNVYNSFIANNKNPSWCYDNFLNHRALTRTIAFEPLGCWYFTLVFNQDFYDFVVRVRSSA
jgi:hypothetical protein